MLEMFVGLELLADGLAGLLDVEIGSAKEPVGFAEGTDDFGGESPAFESDLVDAAEFGRVAICDHERRDILDDLGAASEDGMASDPAELVNPAEAPDHRVILDDDVAGQSAVVGKNDVMAHGAIMGDVGIGQKIPVIADDRFASRGGPAVYRAEFPKGIMAADFEVGRFSVVFEILAALSDRAEGIKPIGGAHYGRPGHGDMIGQDTSGADDHLGADDAIRSNFCVAGDLGARIDDGSRVDH